MTEIFRYEWLTWPEVDALSRDTPLILPVGEGYPKDRLASALGHPEQFGLLPAIPYGWAGSGLQVDSSLLRGLVTNLLNSLRDDGFSRVFALIPQGLQLGLGGDAVTLPKKTESRIRAIPPDDARGKVILVPVGHTEQHAYHLPMSTDTHIIEAVSRGTVNLVPESAYSLPVMPYGVSTHRQSFAGTLNTGGRAFEDFWLGVIDVLAIRGFTRIYLISGHGGNCSFFTNVVKYAGERYPDVFSATTWLYLSGPEGSEALQKYRRSRSGGMGHAGELETALMLYLHPERVHMERVIDEIDFVTTPSYYMDWVDGGALTTNPPWEDDTSSGAYGAGSLATVENGEIWLQAAIREKASHVSEIHEQFERRRMRRAERRKPVNPEQPYKSLGDEAQASAPTILIPEK